MVTNGTVISYPIPAYANVDIHAEYYRPSRFVISGITRGLTTVITTSVDHNYVIGQLVRLLIPVLYGAQQFNEVEAMVISIPSTTQVTLNLNSSLFDAFVASPILATITNVTQASPGVITANNSYKTGNIVFITGVVGMTQLNNRFQIQSANPTTITLTTGTAGFSPYISGGTITLYTYDRTEPQILAIGDYNSGPINSSGRVNQTLYIDGSFQNISP